MKWHGWSESLSSSLKRCLAGWRSKRKSHRLPKTLVVATILLIVFVAGCTNTRTVFVEPGAPIRIGPDVKGHIYYLDPDTGKWTLSDHTVHIPEGWYCVGPEDHEK